MNPDTPIICSMCGRLLGKPQPGMKIMKALSLKPKWALLIATGHKTIETRKWSTRYRGPILICVTLKPISLWSGHAIAVADVTDCRPMTPDDEKAACIKMYPRARAWILENIRAIKPVRVHGALGLFDAPINPADLEFID